MAKKIEMMFYDVNPSAENKGMKHVLFEITTDTGSTAHDWGFMEWTGEQWGEIDMPDKFSAVVKWWANTVDPQILIKEKSKLIKL